MTLRSSPFTLYLFVLCRSTPLLTFLKLFTHLPLYTLPFLFDVLSPAVSCFSLLCDLLAHLHTIHDMLNIFNILNILDILDARKTLNTLHILYLLCLRCLLLLFTFFCAYLPIYFLS